MILELVLIAITIVLFSIYWKQTYSEYGRKLNEFSGPKILPVFGNSLDIRVSSAELFSRFRKIALEIKETFRVWNLHVGMINIITPEDTEILLSSTRHIKKSIIYEFLEAWLGTGLLTSTGAKWHKRRKLLTPAFHFNILRRFVETFGEHSMKLVQDLKKECGKPKTNITPYITNTTLQVICETAMGTTIDSKDQVQKNYLKAIYGLAEVTVERIVTPWLYNNFAFSLFPIGWREKKLVKILHNFTTSVIKEREANFKDSDLTGLDKDVDEFGAKKKKLAMLDLLLSEKIHNRSIDDEGLREEVDTFMFEGHDTTSSGITMALLLLSNHKDVQEKIFIELDEIFGESDRPATYDDLQKMSYLDMCLKECFRIFPPVPIIARHLDEDLKLSMYTVPAGTIVNLQIYDLHHNPDVFPDPENFDPERFSPENAKGRHPYAYVPFSAGPRNCIGQKFALLETKSIISAVLRNFILEPIDNPHDVKFIVDFVLRSPDPINIKIKPRIK